MKHILIGFLFATLASCGAKNSQQTAPTAEESIADSVQFALSSGLLTSMYAKESCSCLFVAELSEDSCRGRMNFVATRLAADFNVDWKSKTVRGFLKPAFQKKYKSATFEAKFIDKNLGCKLTKKAGA